MEVFKQINFLRITFLILLYLGLMGPFLAKADEIHPLQPVDTSNPRSTLSSFLEIVNAAYGKLSELKTSYIVSDRLYFSENEKEQLDWVEKQVRVASRALDLSTSKVGIVATNELADRRTLQLKSILDRLELPPQDSIPDAEMMKPVTFKRWTIPDTEITSSSRITFRNNFNFKINLLASWDCSGSSSGIIVHRTCNQFLPASKVDRAVH